MSESRVIDVDHGLKKLVERMRKADDESAYVKVGIIDSTSNRAAGGTLTNAQIGAIHEFGSPAHGIPERSFLRATFDANKSKYRGQLRKLCELILDGKTDTQKGLALLGLGAAADVQNRIRAGISPANAESTIEQKGSTKPLVDTGQLLGSISSAVVAGKTPGVK